MAQAQLTQTQVRKIPKVPLAKLGPNDDAEAFLTSFERSMAAYRVRCEDWVYLLSPQLTDKALLAYTELHPEKAGSYYHVKEALLQRYAVTPESSRRKFRATTSRPNESMIDLALRVRDLGHRWLRRASSREDVEQLILLEQYLSTLPPDLQTWLRERKPNSLMTAAHWAQDYQDARGRNVGAMYRSNRPGDQTLICHHCHLGGHMAKDCPRRQAPSGPRPSGAPEMNRINTRRPVAPATLRCYNCNERGHIALKCPKSSTPVLYASETKPEQQSVPYANPNLVAPEDLLVGDSYFCAAPAPRDCPPSCFTALTTATTSPEFVVSGSVNGIPVDAIVIDTACTRTMVHRSLISEECLTGDHITIRCAHGDEMVYPLACITLAVGTVSYFLTVVVSDTLPRTVLLGRDVPGIQTLLQTLPLGQADALQVTTRSHGPGKATPAARENPTPDMQLASLFPFHEDLFGQPRQPRPRRDNVPILATDVPHSQPVPGDRLTFADQQRSDPTLQTFWGLARSGQQGQQQDFSFIILSGLLYRQCNTDHTADPTTHHRTQLVLPAHRRLTVLQLAHAVPMAGHMGQAKTAQRILLHFWWPGILADVAEHCRVCSVCQKCARRETRDRAELVPLPVIGEPFRCVAVDIIGPLQRTRSGKRYILTLVDRATRYPEAIALTSIDAEKVADALISIFSRVGLPDSILSDQGSNFTSEILKQVAALLRIQLTTSSPYHQQTNGLVERFNGTLKSMLRKYALEAPQSWDELLPYLLFAYREVPQASTGFSPFELLYGRQVRGPLALVKDSWAQPGNELLTSTAEFVISLRDRLEWLSGEAADNLRSAQAKQKAYYDRQSRQRSFLKGDQALLLLPSSPRKLEAAWQGPFTVTRVVDKVNYELDLGPHRRKRFRVFHINLLRQFHQPQLTAFMSPAAADEDDPSTEAILEDCYPTPAAPGSPTISPDLTQQQQTELTELLEEFRDVLDAKPGRTVLVEHDIHTANAQPTRSRPYRLAQAHLQTVKEALEEMLEMGAIQPSSSPWSSPVVLVPKKDGGVRFCVDYRGLNQVADFDAYPMPRTDEILDRVGAAKFISTLDLSRGYWQIPLAQEAQPKTAFTTPFGLFEFLVMPFGLHGAPATFQRCMDAVLRGLSFVAAYLDDVVIYSDSWSDHLQHLRSVLIRLRSAGLTAKPKKCFLAMKETLFLGHIIGGGCVRPDPEKLEAVLTWPVPTTKRAVRSFLGLCGYYRRFIPNFATLATPLTNATAKAAPNQVDWSEDCEEAFCVLKQVLTSPPLVFSPDFTRRFVVHTDASDVGIGAVLAQTVDDQEHPVAYASRKLLPRERRYATVEKEGLAVKWAILKFAPYLLGRTFTLVTDHRPLSWIAHHSSANARVARWAIALQPFSFTVKYRPGAENGNADGLSRR